MTVAKNTSGNPVLALGLRSDPTNALALLYEFRFPVNVFCFRSVF
ncbi:hypothetical protein FHS90_001352 [Rufibacter quisquiliarum]|uniref:Uncharacterized protein n=1 Tax=Rufibacter quisquiliarum TaxID=1549639 RepID=A0A839GP11_9BACT|nr:hypothetical protein [Rufibacter quisquiliarum]